MSDGVKPLPGTALGPLPLVIGITGHRDLREEDRRGLEEGIRRIFAELRDRYPHTPLILLSSLAEGADRLSLSTAITNEAAQALYHSAGWKRDDQFLVYDLAIST